MDKASRNSPEKTIISNIILHSNLQRIGPSLSPLKKPPEKDIKPPRHFTLFPSRLLYPFTQGKPTTPRKKTAKGNIKCHNQKIQAEYRFQTPSTSKKVNNAQTTNNRNRQRIKFRSKPQAKKKSPQKNNGKVPILTPEKPPRILTRRARRVFFTQKAPRRKVKPDEIINTEITPIRSPKKILLRKKLYYSENKSENKPENKSENKPENNPENKPENKFENEPESKLENKSENRSIRRLLSRRKNFLLEEGFEDVKENEIAKANIEDIYIPKENGKKEISPENFLQFEENILANSVEKKVSKENKEIDYFSSDLNLNLNHKTNTSMNLSKNLSKNHKMDNKMNLSMNHSKNLSMNLLINHSKNHSMNHKTKEKNDSERTNNSRREAEKKAIEAFLQTPKRLDRENLTQKKVVAIEAKIDSSLTLLLRSIKDEKRKRSPIKTKKPLKESKNDDLKEKKFKDFSFLKNKRKITVPSLIMAQRAKEKERKRLEKRKIEKEIIEEKIRKGRMDKKFNGMLNNRIGRQTLTQKIYDEKTKANGYKTKNDSRKKDKSKKRVPKKSVERTRAGSTELKPKVDQKNFLDSSFGRFSSPLESQLGSKKSFNVGSDSPDKKNVPSWAKSRALKSVMCNQRKDNYSVFHKEEFPRINLIDIFSEMAHINGVK